MIRNFPVEFPILTGELNRSVADIESFVEEVVFSDIHKVMLKNLSSLISQEAVQEVFNKFMISTAEVFWSF